MKKMLLILLLFGALAASPVFGSAGNAVTAEQALALLKEGNARFAEMKPEHPDATAARLEETAANGQKPFAAVLGCADSRVPVETIFDRGIGDVFTVRVAGNIAADSSVIGSLEYVVEHLGAPLIVVLGHTQCGAVAAAVSGEKLEGEIVRIQKKIEPVARKVEMEYPDLRDPGLTDEAVKQNAIQTVKDILSASGGIRKLVESGSLKIVPAIYDVRTGRVKWPED